VARAEGGPESTIPWVDNPESVATLRWSRVGAVLTLLVFASTVGVLDLTAPRLLTWREIVPPDESLVFASLGWLLVGSATLVLYLASRRAVRRVALTTFSLYVELPKPGGARVVRLRWGEISDISELPRTKVLGGIRILAARTTEDLVLLAPPLAREIREVWSAVRDESSPNAEP
jgi:hypothetical protein